MTDRLTSDIQGAEGLRLEAYKDSLGYWTVGYGHLLGNSKDWTGYTITEADANAFLLRDIDNARVQAEGLPEWQYLDTACRENAVIELVFNLGLVKWLEFVHTRECIEAQDWEGAATNLLDSDWAEQVGPVRSKRLANYLRSGTYPS